MVNTIEKVIQGNSPQLAQASCNMTKGGIPRELTWEKVTTRLTQFIEKKRVDRENDVTRGVNRILGEEQL